MQRNSRGGLGRPAEPAQEAISGGCFRSVAASVSEWNEHRSFPLAGEAASTRSALDPGVVFRRYIPTVHVSARPAVILPSASIK